MNFINVSHFIHLQVIVVTVTCIPIISHIIYPVWTLSLGCSDNRGICNLAQVGLQHL